MDFIKQLKGFRIKRLTKPLTANAFALYMALFELSNDLRFPEQFTAPNSVLQASANISLKAVQRARNELIQKEYIGYDKGSGNQCGIYKLFDLAGQLAGQNEPANCPTNDFAGQNGLSNVQQVSNNCPANCPTNVQQVSTLNNLTITELNSFSDNNSALARIVRFYKENMKTDVTPLIAEAMEDWLQSVDGSLILYAISEAVANNVRNWKYVHRIIQSHFAAGRRTWAEAEEAAQRRLEQRTPTESWEDDIDAVLFGQGADCHA